MCSVWLGLQKIRRRRLQRNTGAAFAEGAEDAQARWWVVTAQRAGYRVMRRDRENVNGRSYNLPLHVAYGSNEGDVTCSYDPDRGLASIPPYDATRGFGRRERGSYGNQAQTLCENYVNQRRGYRVVSVGTPVQHGRNLWDVPMTVQRNGRRQTTTTCRYNAASNKLSLR